MAGILPVISTILAHFSQPHGCLAFTLDENAGARVAPGGIRSPLDKLPEGLRRIILRFPLGLAMFRFVPRRFAAWFANTDMARSGREYGHPTRKILIFPLLTRSEKGEIRATQSMETRFSRPSP